MEINNIQDIIDLLIKWQKFILPIIAFIPALIQFAKLVLRYFFNFEFKADKKKRIKESIEIAKYLTNSTSNNDLVSQMVFEALTGRKVTINTIHWITNCYNPSAALEIYDENPYFLKIENDNIVEVEWVRKLGLWIYYGAFIFNLIVLTSSVAFFVWGVVSFANIYPSIKNLQQIVVFVILIIIFILEVLFFFWFSKQIEGVGVFIWKVKKFYENTPSKILVSENTLDHPN